MGRAFDIYGSLAPAYGKSTLRLIRNPLSRVYLTLLKFAFPDISQPLIAEDLWASMDQALLDLDREGLRESLPTEEGGLRSGRSLCKELIDSYNWMEATVLPDGRTEFRLTSDATEALNVIDRLNTLESVISESRMHTLIEAIQRASVLFSTDYESGREVLQQRLEQAQQDLYEYEQRGGSEPLTQARAHDVIHNLEDLMSQLPLDLRRLEEDVHAQATSLIEQFRGDERPLGHIIAGYLDQGQNLVQNTDHGRSFTDAVRVIGDPAVSGGVVSKLDLIANAPVEGGELLPQAQLLLRGWNQIASGISQVNDENTRASRVIARSIATHDVARDRELTTALKELESAVYAWAERVGRLTPAPFRTSLQYWDGSSLRDRFWTSPHVVPPPQLREERDVGDLLSMEDLRRLGGPLTREVLDDIARAVPLGTRTVDLAQGFNALDASMRRPVEIAGLMQVATSLGLDPEQLETAEYRCVDARGKEVIWMGPRIRLRLSQIKRADERS